jgi:para-nitrobenzyl esterase
MKKLFFYIFSLMFNIMNGQSHSLGLSSLSDKMGMATQRNTQQGIVEGNYDMRSGIQTYFGIPFAQPPVGGLRWKAPQSPIAWKGVRMAKQFGPRAVQKHMWDDMIFRSSGVSEDCLYLNVWTPAKLTEKNLPVLVYFYGGGNAAGDGSEYRYDGEAMAKKGIVVVTCNYRLNIFGNFAHPELTAETSYKASGNYGYLDQLAALKWVKANISNFGGNPNQVTIAGESAGSIAVSYHMASPLSKGLIHGAIGESGGGIPPTMPPISLKDAEKEGEEFAKKAGVNSLKELRALSTQALYEKFVESGKFGFPVVLDGHFIPKQLKDIFTDKTQSDIPLLAGWTSAEVPGMAFMQGKPYTKDNFIEMVKRDFKESSDEILKNYPHENESEVEKSATDLASDRFIAYSTWKWLDLQNKNGSKPVYRYLYAKMRPEPTAKPISSSRQVSPAMKLIGAPHACEIEYAMGNLHLIKDWQWTSDDFKVSETFSSYFANFIKTGNPNGKDLPNWNPLQKNTEQAEVMIISTESKLMPAKQDSRYKILDSFYRN